jgi:hypothetical protein
MKCPWLLIVLGLSANAAALDVSSPERFVCKQGNCTNGQGVVWDALASVMIQGNWRNGATVPGAPYSVTVPSAPGKVFTQVYGQDGMLEQGDAPRTMSVTNGVVPYFSGRYKRIQHSFMRVPVSTLDSGVYNTGTGFEYRGRFEYLPSKGGMKVNAISGYFVFYGDVVDTVDNETESGLYVSDETFGGQAIRFSKGNPGYLAVLQNKYQRDLQLAQGDFREQESQQKWRNALEIIGNVTMTLASASAAGGLGGNNGLAGGLTGGLLPGVGALSQGYGGSVGNDIAIGLVSSMFNQGGSGLDVQQLALQAVGTSVKDSKLSGILTKAVMSGGAAMLAGGSADSVVSAMGSAVIDHTADTVGSVIGQSTGNAQIGMASGALMKQALAVAPSASAPASAQITTLAQTTPLANGASGSLSSADMASSIAVLKMAEDAKTISARLGNAAQLDKVNAPAGITFDGGQLFATNDGVYLSGVDSAGNTVVLKRTAGRGSPSGWLTAKLPKGAATYALASLRPEDPDTFAINWAVYGAKYGASYINNGGVNFAYPNWGIEYFAPVGSKATSSGHWVIDSKGNVSQQKAPGSRSQNYKESYVEVSDKSTVYKGLAAASEDGGTLYVPAPGLQALKQVLRSKPAVTFDLSSFGPGTINTLIAAHGKVWIGYGNQILTLSNGKVAVFARQQGMFAGLQPTFCIAGTTLFTGDGRVFHGVDVTASDPRTFLKTEPSLKPEEMKAFIEVKTAVMSGLTCALVQGSPVLYAQATDLASGKRQLLIIHPR